MSSTITFFPILKDKIPGVVVVNVFAILSTVALVSTGLRVVWLAMLQFLDRSKGAQSREYVFFHTQLGIYAACLLMANGLNGVAGMIGVSQLVHKGITEDSACRAQAIIMQMGNWATAYFTVTIAVHTFNSLVLSIRQSVVIGYSVIALGWLTAGLIAGLPLMRSRPFGPLYGVSGLSCGIRDVYLKPQFFLHLLPIFIASILSALLYVVNFLFLRGTLVIKGGLRLTLNPTERWSASGGNYRRFVAKVARSMLWYPVAYIALLVPYSVTRMLDLSGYVIPFQALILAYTCWFTLGVVNVLLLYNTFRVLGPAFDVRSSVTQHKSLDSLPSVPSTYGVMPSIMTRSYSPEKIDLHRSGGLSVYSSMSLESASGKSSIQTPIQTYGTYMPNLPTSLYSQQNVIIYPDPALRPPMRRFPVPTVYNPKSSPAETMDQSLPVPPRPTPSPLTIKSSLSSLRSRTDASNFSSHGPLTPMSLRSSHTSMSSNRTASVRASSSSDGNVTGWPQPNSRPMLSAVAPSFPTEYPSSLGSVREHRPGVGLGSPTDGH